jgi:tRNA-splicing ligase RtcB
VGTRGDRNLGEKELEQVCLQGSGWAVKNGYGTSEDAHRTEGSGCLEGADPAAVSKRARERGRPQLGTLGAGNHFLEVDLVETVFDRKAADAMNLEEGCLAVQIHCGSRGFGHQICTDFVQQFQSVSRQYGITLPDRELVCAPLDSPEGKLYLAAMNCAANYAFANRHILMHQARLAFEHALAGRIKNAYLQQVYDLAHNIGKLETHSVNGKKQRVCVHRKGATRAFGPGSDEIPAEYRMTGQPVLVPGSMGTASWVLAGSECSMELSFGSCCHGAGRVMSRSQAKHSIRGEALHRKLEKQGILVMAGSMPGLAEEAPEAYKDVDDVVQTVSAAGLARKVARMRPLIVIKG